MEILEGFINEVFSKKDLKVFAYDMKYPDRNDIIYYLLFAFKKNTIKKIMKDIFAKTKEKTKGPSLWGRKHYEQGMLEF